MLDGVARGVVPSVADEGIADGSVADVDGVALGLVGPAAVVRGTGFGAGPV